MLIDEGRLIREAGSWKSAGRAEQVVVPQTISAVLAARLDALPEVEKNILQAASVVGERFELRQLQELAGDVEIEVTLDSLQRKGLVAFGERSDDEVRFRHLLIRDAAYTSLPKSQRAAHHDRFGSALEAEAGDPEQFTEILAHHAERAFTLSKELAMEGDVFAARARRALQWSLAMADRARTRHEKQSLDAALQTGRSAASALRDEGGLETRARIRLLEAQSMVLGADYAGAAKAATEAASLGEQGGLLPLVATARLTEAWIMTWGLAGGMDIYQQTVERAIDAAHRAGDISGEIEARHIGTNVQYATGRLDEFVEINQRLLDEARSMGDDARAALILDRLQHVEQMRGNMEISDTYVAEADSIATKLGLRNIALSLLRARAHRHLFLGDFGAAMSLYTQLIAAAEEAGAVQLEIAALRFKGMGLGFQRRYSEMAEVLDRALDLSESTGERWNRTEVLGLRARAALGLGDTETADQFIKRALETLRDEDVTAVSEVHDHLGVIRAAQGRYAEAESALRRSVEVVAATHYVWVTGNAVIDLAKFLAQRGQVSEASSLLEPYAKASEARGWRMWELDMAEARGLIAASASP